MDGNREEYSTPIDIESNLTDEILRLEYLNHRSDSAVNDDDNPHQLHAWDLNGQDLTRDVLADKIASIGYRFE